MIVKNFNQQIEAVTNPLAGSIPYTFTFTKTVKKHDIGKTLLAMYQTAFPHKPVDYWKDKISNGSILVNKQKATCDTVLQSGWITQHTLYDKTEPTVNTQLELVFEDENILVLNKPAPLPVHASGRFIKNTVLGILQLAFPLEKFKTVHRLDANTTGLLVLAKNTSTANELIQQFTQQTVSKQYLAWVEGVLTHKQFTITETIGKAKTTSGSRAIAKQGVSAKTTVTVLQQKDNTTLVSLAPKSGRTNQLRLHLANIKHPIVGDIGYKDANYFKENPLTYPQDCLMLHAWKLQFMLQKKVLEFVAPIPDKFISLNK